MVTASSISPGEEGALEITFDGKNRSGEQIKTVRVSTNDPRNEVVIVTIRAFIRTPITIEPKLARFGALDHGEERIVRLKVRFDQRDKVSVTRVRSSSPGFGARLVDDPEGGGGKILEVKSATTLPLGKFQEKITLETTSENVPTVEVTVSGRVLGDLRLEPEAIGFEGRKVNPVGSPLEVTVRTVGPDRFRVTGLDDTTGYLETSLEVVEPGRTYRLGILLKTGGPDPIPASFNGILKILTDHPVQPVLELPVYRSGRQAAG